MADALAGDKITVFVKNSFLDFESNVDDEERDLVFNRFWSHFGSPKQRYAGDPFLKVFQGGSRWPILAPLGALLALSWAHLGPILAPCWPVLASSAPHLLLT
jgi:hypothetical protein